LRAILLAWGLMAVAIAIYSRSGPIPDAVAGPGVLVLTAVAAAAAVRAARLTGLDGRTRRAWRAMAAGYLSALVSSALFAIVPTFPGPGDYVRLAAAPFFLLGLLLLTVAPRTRTERLRTVLDIGVVASGGSMALWYWSLGPLVLTNGVSVPVFVAAAAYPLADFVLIFGAAAALIRGAPPSSRRPLAFVVLGLTALVIGDLQHATTGLREVVDGVTIGPETAPASEWLSLLTAFCLLACAAVEQCAGTAAEHTPGSGGRAAASVTLLPYAAVAGGYGLLLIVAMQADLYPWGGLILGAVVMTALVVARQVLVLRENHALVVTDFLTGLSSRPAFGLALSRSLARQGRSDRLTAVLLIDLDGFKSVNDELGHEAGDDLLREFAQMLRATVARTDTVGRLGGDEFAVVLNGVRDADDAVAVALRLTDAMRRPLPVGGRPIVARASIGIALSEPGDTGRDILHRADQAMYRAKRDGTGWAMEDAAVRQNASDGDALSELSALPINRT
jgi:diguanylate cyclase (GGDEF)-like protein